MADTKITALSSLAGAGTTADGDKLVIVDISDTTMGVSGTDKNIAMSDVAIGVRERPVQELTTTVPATPTAGATHFTRKRSGQRRLSSVSPAGLVAEMQPSLDRQAAGWLRPLGNGTVVSANGLAATAIGTATAANWANSSFLASVRRISYISAAAAGSSGGVKHNVLQWWRGNAAGLGGFYFCCRFGFASIPATWRMFVGMYGSTTSPTNADPSSQINLIGIGKDAADTALQFMNNDGTSTATKSSSGLVLPVANDVWEARIYAAPNSSQIDMSIEKLTAAGVIAEYTYSSTDLPATTQGLLPILWANNGTTAAVIDPHLVGMYLETDF